jgi:hypothetical protein
MDKMDAVVFFNGMGDERETWELHTGGQLSQRFIEGTPAGLFANTCV